MVVSSSETGETDDFPAAIGKMTIKNQIVSKMSKSVHFQASPCAVLIFNCMKRLFLPSRFQASVNSSA